jgi:hypothetical protein
VVGLWLESRTVLGAPVWLKPLKFAASIMAYNLTLVWMFRYLPSQVRTRRIVSRTTALVLLVEMGIIGLQAARGVPSHFNVSSSFDQVLFSIMGTAIAAQTISSVAVAVALWRQKFADAALGWALRLGMIITIVGASLGGLMPPPGPAQLSEIEAGVPSLSGAHTVGAPDGGPGLAVTGWSKQHGDLRIPHFVGLHALQVIPLIALGLRRSRRSSNERVRLVVVASVSYASAIALLLWQALRGQALIAPDAITLSAWMGWFVFALTLAAWAVREPSGVRLGGRNAITFR